MEVTWRKSSYSGGNGGGCIEVGTWRKSSHSGDCVEVGAPTGIDRVLVRDTKDRQGPTLAVSPQVWRRFAERVKATA